MLPKFHSSCPAVGHTRSRAGTSKPLWSRPELKASCCMLHLTRLKPGYLAFKWSKGMNAIPFLLHSSGFGQDSTTLRQTCQKLVRRANALSLSLSVSCPCCLNVRGQNTLFSRTPVIKVLTVHTSERDESLPSPSCSVHEGCGVARRGKTTTSLDCQDCTYPPRSPCLQAAAQHVRPRT